MVTSTATFLHLHPHSVNCVPPPSQRSCACVPTWAIESDDLGFTTDVVVKEATCRRLHPEAADCFHLPECTSVKTIDGFEIGAVEETYETHAALGVDSSPMCVRVCEGSVVVWRR